MLVAYGGPPGKFYLIARENAYDEPRLRRFTFQPDLNIRTRQGVWAPEDDWIFKGVSEAAAKIVKHGGAVGVGAHHEVQGIGTPWDLLLISSGGMPPHDGPRSMNCSVRWPPIRDRRRGAGASRCATASIPT